MTMSLLTARLDAGVVRSTVLPAASIRVPPVREMPPLFTVRSLVFSPAPMRYEAVQVVELPNGATNADPPVLSCSQMVPPESMTGSLNSTVKLTVWPSWYALSVPLIIAIVGATPSTTRALRSARLLPEGSRRVVGLPYWSSIVAPPSSPMLVAFRSGLASFEAIV